MKRVLAAMVLMGLAAAPGLAGAEANAAAGQITLLTHIDFVYRYSQENEEEGWNGYESYNTEFVVVGLAGRLGDYVSWVITEELTFIGTNAAAQTGAAGWNYNFWLQGPANDTDGNLLDARVNFHLGPVTLSAGRFLPPTSMTWNPHLLKVMHTINYPLINGSGLQPGRVGMSGLMLPLPLYQSGVMATLAYEGITFQIGSFNGTDMVGGPNLAGSPAGAFIAPMGIMNTMDIDNAKGTAMKLTFDFEGVHVGGFYYGEEADVELYNPVNIALGTPKLGSIRDDATITQWGVEVDFNSEVVFAQAQYLNTHLDLEDSHVPNIWQFGYYGLAGVHITPQFDLVGRYDFADYDEDDTLATDKNDVETNATAGAYFHVNENVTVGADYTWKWLEGIDANTNELAVIIETNLF